MQKVTAFLEQHLQWIAIGLGALFCLYMTYSYVITPPAEAPIGSVTYGPSEIDPYTAENVAQKLQTAMQNSAKIRMEVPQYVQAFQDAMTWKNAEPVQLAGMIDPAYSLDVKLPPLVPDPNLPPQQGVAVGGDPNQEIAPGTKIAALPIPPKPRQPDPNTAVKYGRSVIIPPPAPGQASVQPQPGVVPPGAIDKDWVTQMWTISMGDLDAAFRKAGMHKLPPELRKTMFLHVEMVREEMVDGKWGNEVVIPHTGPTRNNQPMLPYPGDGPDPALRQAQFQYAAWASTSTPDIIQPLFHVTVPNKGDQWTKPGAQLAAPGQVFDPAQHVGGRGNLTEEQWQAVLQWRRDQQKLLQEQKRQGTPRGPRTPRGGRPDPADMEGEGMMYAPARHTGNNNRHGSNGGSPPHFAPAPGRRYQPPYRGGYGPADMGMMEDEFGGEYGGEYGGGYGGAQAPGMPQPGTDYPTGEFDPLDPTVPPPPWKFDPIAQKPRDIEAWAHDDNVSAGKTYRYKMRYRLKNPIFGANNIAEPEALSQQFALVSEFSDWTTPVTVPSLVNFFVAGGFVKNRGTVDFEIFRWDEGQQKAERFSVGPGDVVGGERNGVDFSTDWTVVDFREDPRTNDSQILLVNNKDGSVIARSFSGDRNDKLYQALKAQVKTAADAAAAAAGGAVPPPRYGTAAAR